MLRKMVLAVGILLLLFGAILLAVSKSATVIPAKRIVTQPKEVTNQDGAYSLSVQDNFTAGDVFNVDFAITSAPTGGALPESLAVDTNVTDPSRNATLLYVFVAPNPSTYGWEIVEGGNWNLTAVANSTGVYGISIFPDPAVIKFSRLTVQDYHAEPEKILYPYSLLSYGGFPAVGLGLVLSVFGAFTKTKRVRRTGRMSVRQSGR
jgi:hypothetical protein